MFYVCASDMCVCMYVPAADRIAAAISRSPFGLLPACLYRPGDGVRAHEGHVEPRGASSLCYNAAFEATVPGRDRTFPGYDLSGPPSLAIGGASGLYEPSGLGGLRIGFIIVELLNVLCMCFGYVCLHVCTCRRPNRCRYQSESLRTSSGMLM